MNWESLYSSKMTTVEGALAHIKSGDRIYIGGGAGVPESLTSTLPGQSDRLRDVEITHILTFADAPYVAPEYADAFRVNALFIGANVRGAVQKGYADFTPVHLSQIPSLFHKTLPLDVALISVSPPDEHGFCCFGVEVGTTKPAAESARLIIAEVNRQMPRTMGNSFIHVSRLNHIVEVDRPLPEAPQGGTTPEHKRIGEIVAEMIPDGATLQTGIGSIPDAVLQNLGSHRDLGVHTELFSDGVIDLVESGVITCARKSFHPGKIVAGFLFGTQRLYDFVHQNPLIEMHPTGYVNDPFNIARNNQMVAINSAVQVDLTGQVSADSIGPRLYSGAGGQVDFVRGAARAEGGLPIIALQSTARRGSISRIVPMLNQGAGVVTTRYDVHYVVTEYGVASLHGRCVRERARELIRVAHPQFREELECEARQLGYI
ncbi:MAG: acetyl-CoA hydrolase/transferase C-terminal domain-containing protein [Candidatus Promineifilaceae bacterium]|nr:acetyl-CoA hydrolase/transferase C-terminal domain-containing protein [Candidatus Promineifilaceae bacterium]